MSRIVSLIYAALTLFYFPIYGQDQELHRESLRSYWESYDENTQSWVPWPAVKKKAPNLIRILVGRDQLKGRQIEISAGPATSAFFKNQIIGVSEKRRPLIIPGDSLLNISVNEFIEVRLFQNRGRFNDVNTHLIYPGGISFSAEDLGMAPSRPTDHFKTFFIAALLFLGGLLSVLTTIRPKATSEFFMISRAFALRDRDENLFKAKLFSDYNIGHLIFYAFLAGMVLSTFVYTGSASIELFQIDHSLNAINKILFWASLSLLILGLFLGKVILVNLFVAMFRLQGFFPFHIMNYVRLSLILFGVVAIVQIIFVLGFDTQLTRTFDVLLIGLILILILRPLLIYFKLMNAAPFSFVHLFSYLCATELIPFLISIKIILT